MFAYERDASGWSQEKVCMLIKGSKSAVRPIERTYFVNGL